MSVIFLGSAKRVSVAALALVCVGLAAPQASAVEGPSTVGGVRVASVADAETRAVALAAPRAVQATATLCGTGYELTFAERLPDASRQGTLFHYRKNGVGSCVLFDNNTGQKRYMKLKLCETSTGKQDACVTDEGYFTQYAGPLRVKDVCGEVTAIMKLDKASAWAVIDRKRLVPPCK
ncbi:hypothetical protein ACFW17_35560 [Streptomyces sp. NPDC058961]|uniref:hypothetical protein n=1 Tax=Streptomyces sp. NPDC058961 TaxID=3346680 RepID=UPI003687F284